MIPHTRNKVYRVFDKQLKIYLEGDELNYWFEHPDTNESYDIGQFMRQPQRFWVQEKTEFVATCPDGSLQALYEGDVMETPGHTLRMIRSTPDVQLYAGFSPGDLPADQDNYTDWQAFRANVAKVRDQSFRIQFAPSDA